MSKQSPLLMTFLQDYPDQDNQTTQSNITPGSNQSLQSSIDYSTSKDKQFNKIQINIAKQPSQDSNPDKLMESSVHRLSGHLVLPKMSEGTEQYLSLPRV